MNLLLDGQRYRMAPATRPSSQADVYVVTIQGDLHLKRYVMQIDERIVRDPYGVMVDPRTNENVVVNLSLTEPIDGWIARPPLKEREDSVIYEMHVRDFTVDTSAGVDPALRGTFLGVVQPGTRYRGVATGLDHLRELGVTHVQILPMFDYGYCSKLDPKNSPGCYNWGYGPQNFNVPEELYALDPNNPVERIRELKTMINELHRAGIRVIMDVVYNHTVDFGIGRETTFSPLTNRYFLARDLTSTGNTVNPREPMVNRFIRDSLEYWVREYHVDGFRFDLMGVFDYETVGEWGRDLNVKFPDAKLLLYGEPWSGYASDPDEPRRVRLGTIARIADAHVGVFNPKFRDACRSDGNSGEGGGFIFNQLNDLFPIKVGSRGAIRFTNDPMQAIDPWDQMFASDPEQTINYVDAHDNLTLRDKILAWARINHRTGHADYLERIQMFGTAIVLTSQGIPFLHAGSEFLRSKKGERDSWNLPDEINKIDWSLKHRHKKSFDYVKKLISLRRAHPAFRMTSWQQISDSIETSQPKTGVVINHFKKNIPGESWREAYVILNSAEPYRFKLPAEGRWRIAMSESAAFSDHDQVVTGEAIADGTAVTVIYRE